MISSLYRKVFLFKNVSKLQKEVDLQFATPAKLLAEIQWLV